MSECSIEQETGRESALWSGELVATLHHMFVVLLVTLLVSDAMIIRVDIGDRGSGNGRTVNHSIVEVVAQVTVECVQ